ncbi:hypothetical protein CEXT_800411 [Caerostris extrusa]|uniref:Uncharacterized protein n=1 Tax=Caerostris extrusa TaxID=172846 RepID=A0AAV4RD84_CAEEX|nr:hypothetical protein CEXT_800411 [Caerostris extrusa]
MWEPTFTRMKPLKSTTSTPSKIPPPHYKKKRGKNLQSQESDDKSETSESPLPLQVCFSRWRERGGGRGDSNLHLEKSYLWEGCMGFFIRFFFMSFIFMGYCPTKGLPSKRTLRFSKRCILCNWHQLPISIQECVGGICVKVCQQGNVKL